MRFLLSLWLHVRVLLDTLYLRLFVSPRKRPENIDIGLHFGLFVKNFGDEICDEKNPAPQTEIADYLFRANNVIAELKTLEDDPYDVRKNPTRLFDDLKKAGMSDEEIYAWVCGQGPLSHKASLRFKTVFQRRIESIARKARDQINSTRHLFGMPDAKGLLLIANDNNYLFNFPQKLALISDVMARHVSSVGIHGVVFFSPNVASAVPGSLREWHPWATSYDPPIEDTFVEFVNKLGHEWGLYFQSLTGETGPDIKIADNRVAANWMKYAKNIDVRK